MKEARVWGTLVVLVGLAYFAASLRRNALLDSSVFDLGIHYQTLWLMGHGMAAQLSTRGLHAFADHFNPIAGVFALLCRVPDSEVTLLGVQAVVLALAGLPAYFLARRSLAPAQSAAAALLLLVQPALLALNGFDFHFNIVLVPLSLTAAWALETGSVRGYAWSLLLFSATHEAAGFSLLFLAPVAARLRGWKWGAFTGLWGLLSVALATASLRAYGDGLPTQYLSLYSQWGDSPGAILENLFRHPLEALTQLWNPLDRAYLVGLVGGFLVLPLFSPLRCLPVVPALLGNLLSWRAHQHSIEYHYNAAIVGFLAWAALDTLGRLSRHKHGVKLVNGLLALGLLQALFLAPPRGKLPPVPPAWQEVVAMIPPDASLALNNGGGAALCGRPILFVLPNPFYPQAWGNRPQALLENVNLSRVGGPAELRRAIDECPVEFVMDWTRTHKSLDPAPYRWLVPYALLNSRRYGAVHYDSALLLLRRGAPWTDNREKYLLREFAPP